MKDEKRDDDADEPEAEPDAERDAGAEDETEVDKADAPDEPAPDEPAADELGPEPTDVAPEKPSFTQGWPASSELDRLLDAFERGNYAYVRSEAPKVAERASDPAVKAAALDLRKRIDPAPLAGILVFVAIGLLVVLAGHYLGKHNPGAPPAVPPASTNAPLQPTTR